jgi:hypothetical protein
MSDVVVQAQRLAGIGWRYSVPTDPEVRLMIVVEDRSPRHLMIVDPSLDASLTTVRLSEADAGVVAALLTGARFRLEVPGAPAPPDHLVEPRTRQSDTTTDARS